METKKIEKFYNGLPEHIIPVQKSVPPFIKYPRGYGYMGVLLLDTNLDKVQCHICGVWKKALGSHVQIHQLNAEEYKDKVGLFHKEPLMSLKTLKKFKETWSMEKSGVHLPKTGAFKEGHGKVAKENGSEKMQYKNRYGTCDAQLKFRVELSMKKHGRLPTEREEPKIAGVLRYRFGSYHKGLQALKINP